MSDHRDGHCGADHPHLDPQTPAPAVAPGVGSVPSGTASSNTAGAAELSFPESQPQHAEPVRPDPSDQAAAPPLRPSPDADRARSLPGSPSTAERSAMTELVLLVEPGSAGLRDELSEFGALEALQRLRKGTSCLRIAFPPNRRTYDEICPPGTQLVLRGDADYPTQLDDLDEPPQALWVRGSLDLRLAAARSVSVVGARAASGYGQRVARELGNELAIREWAVVSGAAFGIDAAAHRGALGAPGPTIAVLACGIDIAYPRSHENLISAIAGCGSVISELPPGSAPLKFRFLARNRIIAALTRGCVIVEAAQRSGAVATANRAMELGRPLMAVPGPVDVVSSAGTNRLLHDGSAQLIRDAQDVIEVILGERDATQPMIGLPEEAHRVLAALSPWPVSSRSLAAQCQLDADFVGAILGLLELTGRAARSEQGWRTPRAL